MDVLDFIVFFIWVFIFHIFFSIRRRRYSSAVLKKHHKRAFWIKVFATFCFCMFLLYISPGDTTGLYYPEGVNIQQMIVKEPSKISILFERGEDFDQSQLANIDNAGYFEEESNFMVTRIVAILSFFTFGTFMSINLIFSMIAFSGIWRLYRFFYEQYPHLSKQFAIAILYLPTFVFWSSGILKDPICVGALGWITYSLYSIFYTRNNVFRNLLLFVFFAWLLVVLKIYILVSYLPFFILFLLLSNLKLVKNKLVKAFLVLVFLSLSIAGFLRATETIGTALGKFAGEGITKSIKSYQANYAQQENQVESNFSLGVEFDGSPMSLVKIAPAAIVATLYRPFIWESKKLSTLLSSLESLAMMLFTLYVILKTGIFRFLRTIIKSPMVLYCFMFAIIFSLFVGATTLNFGTLVRYKIPAMPFYLIALFLILEINRRKKKNPAQGGTIVV